MTAIEDIEEYSDSLAGCLRYVEWCIEAKDKEEFLLFFDILSQYYEKLWEGEEHLDLLNSVESGDKTALQLACKKWGMF